MKIEFTGGASILAKKSEKEKRNPEMIKEVIKIGGYIDQAALAKLLVCSTTEIDNWWHHDDDGHPRFQTLEDQKMSNVYADYYLAVDDFTISGVSLDKFVFSLKRYRRAYVEFYATFIGDGVSKEMLDEYYRHGFPHLTVMESQFDTVEAAA